MQWEWLAYNLLEMGVEGCRERIQQMSTPLLTDLLVSDRGGDYLLRGISERGDIETLDVIKSHAPTSLWCQKVCVYTSLQVSLLCYYINMRYDENIECCLCNMITQQAQLM